MYLTKLLLLAWANLMLISTTYSSQPLSHRKSLSFRPVLPHATFVTALPYHLRVVNSTSERLLYSNSSGSSDPFLIAREFLDVLLKNTDKYHTSYEIRNDSYTDTRTGVTHVYVKQTVVGLEVSNGLININIFKGHVISYGDSFFRGPVQVAGEIVPTYSVHRNYCDSLLEGTHGNGKLEEIYDANCRFLFRNTSILSEYVPTDPRAAVLMFMIAATPSTSFADTLNSNFDEYLSRITVRSLNWSQQYSELDNVPGALGVVPVRKAYIQVANGNNTYLKLVWKLEIEMTSNWYEIAIDILDPSNIVSVIDWTSDGWSPSDVSDNMQQNLARYRVYEWGIGDPARGQRTIQTESMDAHASPFGWHKLPASSVPQGLRDSGFIPSWGSSVYQLTMTTGNNIFAQTNWNGGDKWLNNYRPNAGRSFNFDYPYNPDERATSDPVQLARSFVDASITQLFYSMNDYHDFLYLYGFDEISGNFQEYNFNRGGREHDAVIMYGQDGSGYDNAFFQAPPDGLNGRSNMYLWNTANPYRDGDFDSSIPIHEYTHGLSMRLTGGPSDSGCLSGEEAGGMGEGWGDWFAIMITSDLKSPDHYAVMSAWASNDPRGIRKYPYTLNVGLNPLTYKSLDRLHFVSVHDIGEVWAEFLWVVTFKLVQKHGFVENPFPPKFSLNGTMSLDVYYTQRKEFILNYGNTLMIQLVINAMKLQPCNPNFVSGRDAILQADQVLTQGQNRCALWIGFAERGLGIGAKFISGAHHPERHEDFRVPEDCTLTV